MCHSYLNVGDHSPDRVTKWAVPLFTHTGKKKAISKFTFGMEFQGDAENGSIVKQFFMCGPTGRQLGLC